MTVQEEAGRFISEAPGVGHIGVLYHGDADGIAGAVISYKFLERLGSRNIMAIPLGRGLNPHSPETRAQLANSGLSKLIVVDSGSRAGEVLPGVPTLVIDHHRPSGIPQVEVFLNTYGEEPVRPASLAVYDICNSIIDVEDLDWVAAVGTVGDLGPKAPFPIVEKSFEKYGRKNIASSVVLVNAGRRHRDYKVQLAFNVLLSATEPAGIVKHRVAGAEELERMRHEVQDELWRKAKTPPQFAGKVALFYFKSVHQVHPLIAKVWSQRLSEYIVIAANEEFIPGKVSFSVRTATGINLLDFMAEFGVEGEEVGYGHEAATGGIVDKSQFVKLLRKLGFAGELKASA